MDFHHKVHKAHKERTKATIQRFEADSCWQRGSSAVAASFEADGMEFTDEEIAVLDEEEEAECSDHLWEEARKHRDEAISLEEYCRRRGIEI
jgi:hypothetical protein